MPVNFLTEEQRRRYGRLNAAPDDTQLGGFFHLDVEARRRAMAAHGARNRLGWSIQLGTVRFLGTFLHDPTDVPAAVVDYVAAQLGLDPVDLKGYGERETRWDHQAQIRQAYGYTAFGPGEWFALARWLYTRAWDTNERPSVLFDLATSRMMEAKVLLPGVTVLERLVVSVRERTAAPVPDPRRGPHRARAGRPGTAGRRRRRAAGLPAGSAPQEPHRHQRQGGGQALDRYVEIRALGACGWDPSAVPAGRVAALARFAHAARAQAVAELTGDRKTATLVAFAAAAQRHRFRSRRQGRPPHGGGA